MERKSFTWKRTEDACQRSLFEIGWGEVPYSSALEPLLFVIYVNDLPGQDSYLNMFANNAKLKIEVKNDEDCINLEGLNLQNWYDTWLMKFIPGKCIVIRIGHSEKKYLDINIM